MDIPDFELVVQYRVHKLTMCSLLQRMGRGAHDPSRKAVFIILAESKFFIRNQKDDAHKKRPHSNAQAKTQNKRQRTRLCSEIAPEGRGSDGQSNLLHTVMSFDEFLESRQRAYILYQQTHNSASETANVEPMGPEDLDPALSDLINADIIGLSCRRIPITLVFRNNALRTLLILSPRTRILTLHNPPLFQKRTILTVV